MLKYDLSKINVAGNLYYDANKTTFTDIQYACSNIFKRTGNIYIKFMMMNVP